MENSDGKQNLKNCVHLRADERIRTLAKDGNGTNTITISSDKLIPKEAIVILHGTETINGRLPLQNHLNLRMLRATGFPRSSNH